ncbi:uncharacterized protein RJT20DRAFT_128351 [Scheffersomyces xylosifermentans]|uniref:uncharacterized protein n=1 Tax=Scheffersomyces xylosifermentans TaxID=1304137 RepID=UPI00315CF8E3
MTQDIEQSVSSNSSGDQLDSSGTLLNEQSGPWRNEDSHRPPLPSRNPFNRGGENANATTSSNTTENRINNQAIADTNSADTSLSSVASSNAIPSENLAISENPASDSSPSTDSTSSNSPSAASVDDSISRTYHRTAISPQELVLLPFKTLNRILDDLKWTVPMKIKYNVSLLNSRPIDYASELSKIAGVSHLQHEAITLNNALNYSPSSERIELEERNQTLTIIRGLLVNKDNVVRHFRLAVLETNSNPFVNSILDKHEYHLISKDRVSEDDLEVLGPAESIKVNGIEAEDDGRNIENETGIRNGSSTQRNGKHAIGDHDDNDINIDSDSSDSEPLNIANSNSAIIDDAYYKSANSPNGHILRVTLYNPEFSQSDLFPLIDQETIKKRYLAGVEKHPSLSPDTIPNVVHCFKTLIKVLRGPVLLKPEESIKTISLANTVMDAQIEVNLLFQKLGFTLNKEESDAVPPNLAQRPELKESYIRKIQELIYLGRVYGKAVEHNEFQTVYSYSDNLSLVFKTIGEYDKHINQVHFKNHNSNQLPFLISLSVCSYFQDELVIKCFENSVTSDPKNRLHYVDALRNTANFRSGSSTNNKLSTYLKNLASSGDLIGFHDYIDSMKVLGLDVANPKDIDSIDDDVIVAMYKASYKNDTKNYQYYNNQLQTIARARQSKELWEFLSNEIIPVSIALDELNIEEITEDDVVVTAYEFKLDDIMQANGFRDEASEVQFLHKALLSVAVNRKSYLLLNYIETKLPEIIKLPKNDITFSKALNILGADLSTSDFELITNFQNRLIMNNKNDINSDIRILRYSLKLIAEQKKSDILISFLKNGKIDSTLLPAENWPAGLDNIGNTCYLNSLLQYYFCIKPLRELILSFDENEVDVSAISKSRKIGGRSVEESEIKRSNQFIYHLRYLFDEMIHTNKRCVQPSKDLAYLSFLALSQPVEFRDSSVEVIEIPDDDEDLKEEEAIRAAKEAIAKEEEEERRQGIDGSIIIGSASPYDDNDIEMADNEDVDNIEMVEEGENKNQENLIDGDFSHNDVTTPEGIDGGLRSHNSIVGIHVENVFDSTEFDEGKQPQHLTHPGGPKLLPISTDQMESTIEVGRQQDVTECIENVTFQIETALSPERLDDDGEQYDLIKKLFYGKTKQTITPIDESTSTINGKPRISIERFFSLIINVSDHPKSIYDALDNFFNEDIVKLDEGLVKKSITVSELPEFLQFHVQRVMFDRERLMAYKSLEPIPFSEKIYFDRYLDTEDPEILQKRNEVFKWKSEIQQILDQKNEILHIDDETKLTIIDTLVTTKKFLESKIMPHSTMGINPSTIFAIQDEIDALKSKLLEIDQRLEILREKVANQFTNYNKVGYSIFAIFIHRGEASYGHYWVYIKDPQRNIFRKYNDETVTEVPFSEVFNFIEGNTATPYYIVYVKENLESEYIDPLRREIKN